MATILWQVPQQMFAVARAAIYIVVKHRHANICKRTVGSFVRSQSDQQYKQMGLNLLGIGYLKFEISSINLKELPVVEKKQLNTKMEGYGVFIEKIQFTFASVSL